MFGSGNTTLVVSNEEMHIDIMSIDKKVLAKQLKIRQKNKKADFSVRY